MNVMKKLLPVVLVFSAALSANAAAPRGVPVGRDVQVLAKTLQAKLPALAVDGMCEVERQANGWNFTFRVSFDKISAQEVQVLIRMAQAHTSELRVQGVRVEGSLVGSKRNADPELTKEWTDRILKLIDENG
jgi:hypothetical protein